MTPSSPISEATAPSSISPSPGMSPRRPKLWKKIIALMLIFFLGVGAGAAGTVALIIHFVRMHQSAPDWSKARLVDLDRRLKLTPEQRDKLRPIVNRAGERFQTIGNQTFEEIIIASKDLRADIEKELNPEQKKEFEKMRPQVIAKLREWVQKQMIARQSGSQAPQPPPVSATAPEKSEATPPTAEPPKP